MFALSARLLQPLSAAPRLPSLPRGRRNSASPPRRGARTACKAAMTKHVDGIAEVAGTYEGWLLDQFGVLHDGRVAYPCAIEAVRELHAAGKKVLIISNSSRRSSTTLEKLRPMGFDPSWFAGAITSGEITHRYLESKPEAWAKALGTKCLHFTWGARGGISLDGLGLELVTSPEQADFVLAHGTEAVGQPGGADPIPMAYEDMEAMLKPARERNLPLVIANPDIVTVDGPSLRVMPGSFGAAYTAMGGTVHLMGKPAEVIYKVALEMLGGVDKASMVAVGDSLSHDILGASDAGVSSIFVAGGIHAEALGVAAGEAPSEGALAGLVPEHGGREPTFATPMFSWGAAKPGGQL